MIENDKTPLKTSVINEPTVKNPLSKRSSQNLLRSKRLKSLSNLPPQKRDNTNEKHILFGNRFEITPSCLLGKGSFGEIYIAQDFEDNYKYCALKIENRTKNYFLKIEKSVLELTYNIEGFPKFLMFNSQGENNFLAMELLGPNLSDLFDLCKQRFTLQTTLLVGIQMIQRIQDLHSKNFIHRDIKPENFIIGIGENSNLIYVIDFGLSKKYKDAKMDHLPYREHLPLTGTTRYASINNHLGIEQSRRDDLEAIGYVMIYFIKKRLPWQGCQGSRKQTKYNKILEKKLYTSVDMLCKDLPIEFQIYLNYVKGLRFDERPNYEFLKGIFTDLLFSLFTEDFYYDWTLKYPDDPKNLKYNGNMVEEEKKKMENLIEEDNEERDDKDKDKNKEKDKENRLNEKEYRKNSLQSNSSHTDGDVMDNFDGNEYIDVIRNAYSKKNSKEVNSFK